MPFVKLDTGILNSSLWVDREAREIFIAALCMAVPFEAKEATPAIKVRSTEPSGFEVPAGWYGLVEAAGPGIVRQAYVEAEPGLAALERLSSPDPDSRTPDYEGRRMVRISGGWLVLNFDKYRERDYTAAERAKRYRDRRKEANASRVTTVTSRNETANVTQAEAEAEAEAEADKNPAPSSEGVPYEKFREEWNRVAQTAGLPECKKLTQERQDALRIRWKDPQWRDDYLRALDLIPSSQFLTGNGGRRWKADIDWFLKPDSVTRILEKKYYDNRIHQQDIAEQCPDAGVCPI